MTTTTTDYRGWVGRTLIDRNGDKIGRIDDLYLDDDTGQPEWLAVSTGLFGTRLSFVPIRGAESRGEDMVSQWTKEQVKDAPNAEADGQLSEEEEERLFRHYGLDYGQRRSGKTADVEDRSTSRDDAMTRSEEELRVSKESRETGRVRLRKYVDTEHVSEQVPVTREEVHVEREPITDANRDKALDGPDIREAEHEVILHEERVDADTQAVPKERVRLDKDVVTDEETVEADLRKERVEVEGSDERVRGRR